MNYETFLLGGSSEFKNSLAQFNGLVTIIVIGPDDPSHRETGWIMISNEKSTRIYSPVSGESMVVSVIGEDLNQVLGEIEENDDVSLGAYVNSFFFPFLCGRIGSREFKTRIIA